MGGRMSATPQSLRQSAAGGGGDVADSVRAFMQTVARALTRDGPAAWRHQSAGATTCFVPAEGGGVFASAAAAAKGIDALTHVIAHIELRWGGDVRVE